MTERRAPEAAGDDRLADLDWLADRFVLGELAADDEQAVVDRLADDDPLAAAVARSSRLLTALLAAGPPAATPPAVARCSVVEKPPWPRRHAAWLATGLAAGLAFAAWFVASWPAFGPQPREVVRIWRQAEQSEWPVGDAGDEATVEVDVVPDWMLAAVALDAGESEILEN
jgi:hypothetical protein